MTSFERVMLALGCGQPDCLPLIECVIDSRICKAICPHSNTQTEFEEAMGFDAVCCGAQYRKVSENADGTYLDEWGVQYKPGPELQDHPVKGPIHSKADLEKYIPPDPEAPWRLGILPELVEKFKYQKAVIFRHRAALTWSVFLNGMDNFLMNLLAEPDFAHRVLDRVLEVNIRVARNAVRAGADIIFLGDDYAGTQGPFFSPTTFREFILPRLKKMVDVIHEEGAKVIKHSDGNLWPILDMIVNTDIDGINPIEPIANMDIGEVKQRYKGKVCVVGNIDCSYLLPFGTEREVEATVKKCICKAAWGGGHIICSSNSIHSSVNPRNYLAMIQAVRKYGRYPLNEADLR